MDLTFLLFLPLVFWKIQIQLKGFRPDPLDLSGTKSIKGILAMLVMFYHLAQQLDGIFLFFIDAGGVLWVSIFFFLSGYGLQKSYGRKPGYQKTILRKRIPSVLIPYLVLTLVYWLSSPLWGQPYSILQVLGSLLGPSPVADYAWYMVTILVFYVNYYLSTYLFRPGHRGMGAYHVLSITGWALLCEILGYPYFWYHTTIAFPVGILWATHEERLLPLLKKRYWLVLPAALFVFAATYIASLLSLETGMNLAFFWPAFCSFLLLFVLILMKVRIQNPVLLFLGDLSFPLYGIHGLFIRLYRSDFCYISHDVLWCMAVIFSSIAAAWLLNQLFRQLLP